MSIVIGICLNLKDQWHIYHVCNVCGKSSRRNLTSVHVGSTIRFISCKIRLNNTKESEKNNNSNINIIQNEKIKK